jgi:hypothetical protein
MAETIRLLRELMPEAVNWSDAEVVGEAKDRRIINVDEWLELSEEIA